MGAVGGSCFNLGPSQQNGGSSDPIDCLLSPGKSGRVLMGLAQAQEVTISVTQERVKTLWRVF